MNNDAFIVQIISIHAPAKGATYFDYLKVSVRIFQSTLPRRERRASYETRTSGRCYFNPRSREGSDSSANSIINRQTLFQSTLPRRERPYNRSGQLRDHRYFNPRSREGSDATFPRPRLRRDTRFQSTLPRRERPRWQARSSSSFPFQSTLPRRERPIITGLVTLVVLFQSTLPRRERRLSGRHPPGHRGISIHAPAKGATYSRSFGRPPDNISIHAPAKGATRQIPGQIMQHSISIHAPAKGATFAKLI